MAGGRYYGSTVLPNGNQMTGPFDGRPRPSDYPALYGTATPDSASDYLNQDFLLTDKGADCIPLMQDGLGVQSNFSFAATAA